MVRLKVANQYLELQDQEIVYNLQINDIFYLDKLASSYTNEFIAPKTPHNTKILEGLGLVGSTSRVPFSKIPADLIVQEQTIIKEGWFGIRETSDYYFVHIMDGINDFFKEIENKTLGKHLDLTEINHTKDLHTVADSNDNENYRYIVADYGGRTQLTTGVNIDYLAPSVRVKYLWDKIFSTLGYTYWGDIFESADFADLWMTYPKAVEGGIAKGILSLPPFTQTDPQYSIEGDYLYFDFPSSVRFQGDIRGFTKVDHNVFTANESKDYKIDIKFGGHYIFGENNISLGFALEVKINDSSRYLTSDITTSNPTNRELILELNKGDKISFRICIRVTTPPKIKFLQNNYLEINFNVQSIGQADFTNALDSFSIKDFVKEIIWRFGVVPTIHPVLKRINFYDIPRRLNTALALDFSDSFVSREKETYLNEGFSQENYFRHKYNEQDDNFNDGCIDVNNKNLPDNSTIVTSKIYSPELGLSTIRPLGEGSNSFESNIFPIWKAEVKQNAQGDISVDYKSLSGRFYFLKAIKQNMQIRFISESLSNEVTRNAFSVAGFADTTFKDLIPKHYKEYDRVLQDFKIHYINLKLELLTVSSLVFVRPYYFEQESSYYILNKLQWSTNGYCQGEFIKLKK